MPDIIIEQSQEVINYINMLKLPVSGALKNHMVHMISGIITTEGNKNISNVYSRLTCNRDRSSGSRFLGEYKWSNEYVDYKRINHSLKTVRENVPEGTVGFFIVDDTLSKKDNSTKKIEGLDYHHSHSDGKTMWSHCVVTSHYKISEYSLPLNFKLYLRKQFFGQKAKKLFKNKQELAMQLIDEFTPVTETTYLLVDAWYTSGKLMLHALKRGYHTIGRIKSNRVIYPGGIKTNIKEFATHIRSNETCIVTAGDDNYYVYRYEGKINDLENAVILICWSKKDLSDTPAFIVSTDVSLTTSTIVGYYQNRRDIEVSYRYHKNSLGFDEYQVESLTSIKRFWSMVFMTYTFLELFRVSKRRTLKLETIGDTIGYFRKQYMVCIAKFAYSCAEKGVSLDDVVAKLGVAA
ncbi:IS701-like element ISCth16 family transposase [Acetivibrio straminisolvens]|uniref:IS701-like element ISCth16 family transposase n=1 Tax=Acetivibrio straminisolvens TaxID=253314 RepID=UPI0022407FC9|nr:IS701-like element ISCth16 family transposase [Acetivibrio straminisolvens]